MSCVTLENPLSFPGWQLAFFVVGMMVHDFWEL